MPQGCHLTQYVSCPLMSAYCPLMSAFDRLCPNMSAFVRVLNPSENFSYSRILRETFSCPLMSAYVRICPLMSGDNLAEFTCTRSICF